MEQPVLQKTGYVMILGGGIFALLSFFPFILNLHLSLSVDYDQLSAFGPAGEDIVMAFGVHIGALVIALGFVMLTLAKHYHPDMKKYLLTGIGIWYVLDCVSSLILGYQLNVIPNTIFLLSFFFVIYQLDEDIEG